MNKQKRIFEINIINTIQIKFNQNKFTQLFFWKLKKSQKNINFGKKKRNFYFLKKSQKNINNNFEKKIMKTGRKKKKFTRKQVQWREQKGLFWYSKKHIWDSGDELAEKIFYSGLRQILFIKYY